MASSVMVSTAAVKQGLKSTSAFPVSRKPNNDLSSLPSNGGRIRCILVWPPEGLKEFETLSYLPECCPKRPWPRKLTACCARGGFLAWNLTASDSYTVSTTDPLGTTIAATGPCGKLPMFGCTDSSQVLTEVEEAKKAYPNYYIRIISFDNRRQVQCISFIVYKPPFPKSSA